MNITNSTKDLIHYLYQAGHLEVCTEIGTCFGSMSWKPGLKKPSRVNASLNVLKSNGLICCSDFFSYGIRWSKVELTEKGVALFNTIGVTNE